MTIRRQVGVIALLRAADFHRDGVGGQDRLDVFAPLDGEDAAIVQIVKKAGGVKVLVALHPIHVEVVQGVFPVTILMHQRKGGAGDLRLIQPEPPAKPPGEGGFARAHRPFVGDDVAAF